MIRDPADFATRLSRGLRDRYSIEGEVGQGGMALVYRATDLKHGRSVALKVLRPEIAAALGSDRFLREIQIAAHLTHPHILPVHESGEADGVLYYTMPFVDGESLRDVLRREKRFSLEDTLRILREVGPGLGYAHGQGVVHRDLKPENIMLAEGIAVITDFGIARAVTFAGGEQLTQTGMAIGTPAYMSPEQASGVQEVDGRSDVYSLACVAHEMLTGAPPFQGANLLAVLASHATDPVPDLRRARDDVPDHVAEAIATALAKAPADRFATVEDFLAALEGREHAAPRKRFWWGWRRRTRAAVAAGTALLVLALAGYAVFTRWSSPPREGPPVIAVLSFEHVGPPEEAYFTEGMTDEISSRIAEIGDLAVISRASTMHFDLRQHSVADVARDLGTDYLVVGSIRSDRRPDGTGLVRVTPRLVRASDGQEVWSGRFDAALTPGEIFRVQGAIAQNVAEALHVTLLPQTLASFETKPTANIQAYEYFLRGNLYAAQRLIREEQAKAIEMYDRAVALDPAFAVAWGRLAEVGVLHYYLSARSPGLLRRIEQAVERAHALAPEHAQTRIARGYLYALQGDNARGLAEFRAALEREPNNSSLLMAIGDLERRIGDLPAALASFSRGARLDPRSPYAAFEVAVALFTLRRFDEALVQDERVIAMAPDWLPALVGRAGILLYQGRVAEARQYMTELAGRPGVVDRFVPLLVGDPLYRAHWAMTLAQPYQDALDQLTLENSRVDSAAYYFGKAQFYQRVHRPAPARTYFDSVRAVLVGRRAAGVGDAFARVDLGLSYAALGRPAEARAQADSAPVATLLAQSSFRGPFAALDLVRLWVALEDRAAALTALRELLAVPSAISAPFLRADPTLMSLAQEPGFEAAVRER